VGPGINLLGRERECPTVKRVVGEGLTDVHH